MKRTLLILSLLVAGYSAGIQVEANTHALQVSQITGTPYLKVLGAWQRLQASDMTDTDCARFDSAVGINEDNATEIEVAMQD